ncbi:toll/interleukin-1 receptor domain-containing protein [Streptomyces rubrogriseus]|uniref:toll/interleukin-1 receptor domain-containing protein n=1 Tax=Streptomyces rubrogriseus TaxID=194673 RepID=UPI0037A8A64E
MRAFISHNHRDKPRVNPLASRLQLLGMDVWLDAWKIKPGDSIVGEVNAAIGAAESVLVFWSANAAVSRWVNTEWEAALSRCLRDGSVRVIPVMLDDTPLPSLLEPIMWVSLADGDVDRAAREITGIKSQAEINKAMQQTLEESGIEYRHFPGYGAAVGCPRCGAPSSELESWSAVDRNRDDMYAGVRCIHCDWTEGGEI